MTVQEQAKQKYKEYLQKVPELRRRQIERYTMLVFTFTSLTVFLIFAINPTVGTIIGLRKQLKDGKVVKVAVDEKLTALTSLDQEYSSINAQLPAVDLAIPKTPDAPLLFAEIQGLSNAHNVELTSLQTDSIPLTLTTQQLTFIPFTLTATGTYTNLMDFMSATTTNSRLLSFSDITLSKADSNGPVTITMKGQAYFKP